MLYPLIQANPSMPIHFDMCNSEKKWIVTSDNWTNATYTSMLTCILIIILYWEVTLKIQLNAHYQGDLSSKLGIIIALGVLDPLHWIYCPRSSGLNLQRYLFSKIHEAIHGTDVPWGWLSVFFALRQSFERPCHHVAPFWPSRCFFLGEYLLLRCFASRSF